MSDISILTDEEYSRVCTAIPHKLVVGYFKKYPKEFAKIRPGFRATALKPEEASKLMIKHRQNNFIASFVNDVVEKWLYEIDHAVSDYQKDGKNKLLAYIYTLSKSFFIDNISAYFHLTENDFSEEDILLIQNMVSILQDYEKQLRVTNEKLAQTSQEFEDLKREFKERLSKKNRQVNKLSAQIEGVSKEVKKLQIIETLYEKDKCELEKSNNDNNNLKKQIASLNEQILELQKEITLLIKEKEDLAIAVREQIEQERIDEVLFSNYKTSLCPKDMEEFLEYLGYNLEDIGIDSSPEFSIKERLSSYISNCIFKGKPIICDKAVSKTLVACISNALIGTTNVSSIHFSSETTERTLREFLLNSDRIVVLDNFLGNFNDSVLLTIVDDYKNKIIFFTYSFSKTLKYISDEMFAYCYYIGASKIPELFGGTIPDEDPSIIDEDEYSPDLEFHNNKYTQIMKRILIELNFKEKVVNSKVCGINNEFEMCELLMFDIIPYCLDVLSINPLNYSQTLQKYIQRSICSKMLERWLDE